MIILEEVAVQLKQFAFVLHSDNIQRGRIIIAHLQSKTNC